MNNEKYDIISEIFYYKHLYEVEIDIHTEIIIREGIDLEKFFNFDYDTIKRSFDGLQSGWNIPTYRSCINNCDCEYAFLEYYYSKLFLTYADVEYKKSFFEEVRSGKTILEIFNLNPDAPTNMHDSGMIVISGADKILKNLNFYIRKRGIDRPSFVDIIDYDFYENIYTIISFRNEFIYKYTDTTYISTEDIITKGLDVTKYISYERMLELCPTDPKISGCYQSIVPPLLKSNAPIIPNYKICSPGKCDCEEVFMEYGLTLQLLSLANFHDFVTVKLFEAIKEGYTIADILDFKSDRLQKLNSDITNETRLALNLWIAKRIRQEASGRVVTRTLVPI